MDKTQQITQLFVAGVKSYPDALIAVDEFRRLALKAVRDAVESNLESIATSMGTKLSPSDIQKRFRPKESEIGKDNAKIGVTIRRDSEGWRQYFQFYWELDSSFYFTASFRFMGTADAISISKAISQVKCKYNPAFDEDEAELSIMRRIMPEELTRVTEILSEFLREWGNLWKQLGGLKGLKVNK